MLALPILTHRCSGWLSWVSPLVMSLSYMLLGLCNVDAKMLGEASPTSTTEDWLWFRLNMVTVRPVDTSQSESELPPPPNSTIQPHVAAQCHPTQSTGASHAT